SSAVACGWASQCPQQQPCCSEYGYCSAGTACLGGCNPQGSYGQGYCAPMPVCSSKNYTFADDSRFQKDHADWNGDATKYDWTLDKLDSSNPPIVQNNALVLTLTENGGGTRVSTTDTVLYGTIQASIKTVGAPGVVTAFITMSGVKDEIDFEWTGNNTDETQSNWYWEGDVDDYTHGGSHTTRNRASQFNTYGIEWTPTQLDWLVNGKSVRTLLKSSDKNGRYPQTPSRVQFSVWPAGIKASPQGTIDWSGGLIDWSSPAYTANKAFQAEVAWVSVDCYD
ncbi:glycoside hydrolase family 16 protein, partial [Rhodotorula graminis WP1]